MNARATTAGASNGTLWFALVGGAVAWTAHLLLAYAIAEFGCVAGLGHQYVLNVTVLSWLLLAMSIVMVAGAAAAVVVSYRIGLAAPRAGAADPDEYQTREFVGRFGVIVNLLFLLIVIAQTFPIFFYWGRC